MKPPPLNEGHYANSVAKVTKESAMIRIPPSIFAAVGFFSVSAVCAVPAHAECAQWDASGKLTAVQNNGFRADFTLTQGGSELHGTASHIWDAGSGPFTITGSVDGTIKGDYFEVTAYWWNSTTGVYSGHVGPQGRIEGSTYDKQNPRSMATWYSEQTLRCMPVAGASPAPGGIRPPMDPAMSQRANPPKPVDPTDKRGVGDKAQKGIGEVIDQTKPVDPLDKLGISSKPGTGIGDALKQTKP